jgi:hypothetical protein
MLLRLIVAGHVSRFCAIETRAVLHVLLSILGSHFFPISSVQFYWLRPVPGSVALLVAPSLREPGVVMSLFLERSFTVAVIDLDCELDKFL